MHYFQQGTLQRNTNVSKYSKNSDQDQDSLRKRGAMWLRF
jgi:hypothetical protein